MILQARNITKYYKSGNLFSNKPKKIVLNDINFCLHRKNNLGILGRNGAGKSSLMRILLGLEIPQSGYVEILGKRYDNKMDIKNIRKEISAVFQDPQSSLNPRFSARECILEPLKNFHLLTNPKQQSESLSDLVGLDKTMLDKKSYYFSGGEQQRIAIARAIALQPKILILDEAFSNLDTHLQKNIIDMMTRLQNLYDMTYIVISHDIRIIFQMCKEIITLKNGNIVFETNIHEGIKNALIRDNNGEFSEIFHASMDNIT